MSGMSRDAMLQMKREAAQLIGAANRNLEVFRAWVNLGFFGRIWWVLTGRIKGAK